MTTPSFPKVAKAVASECRRIGAAITQLEDGLIAYASDEISRDALITEMQTIDATQQTLEDLARMLDVFSDDALGDPLQTERAFGAIRQSALQNRMFDLIDSTEGLKEANKKASNSYQQEEDVELW